MQRDETWTPGPARSYKHLAEAAPSSGEFRRTNSPGLQTCRPLQLRATGSSCSCTFKSLRWFCWAGPPPLPTVQHRSSSNSVVITARVQSCIVLAQMRKSLSLLRLCSFSPDPAQSSQACTQLPCPRGKGIRRHRLQLCHASLLPALEGAIPRGNCSWDMLDGSQTSSHIRLNDLLLLLSMAGSVITLKISHLSDLDLSSPLLKVELESTKIC